MNDVVWRDPCEWMKADGIFRFGYSWKHMAQSGGHSRVFLHKHTMRMRRAAGQPCSWLAANARRHCGHVLECSYAEPGAAAGVGVGVRARGAVEDDVAVGLDDDDVAAEADGRVARPYGAPTAVVYDKVAVCLEDGDAVDAPAGGAGGPHRPAVVQHEVAVALHDENVAAVPQELAGEERLAAVQDVRPPKELRRAARDETEQDG